MGSVFAGIERSSSRMDKIFTLGYVDHWIPILELGERYFHYYCVRLTVADFETQMIVSIRFS